jgi:N-acyl-phosphatidylethanolamine-hydrolysing phospholipase D
MNPKPRIYFLALALLFCLFSCVHYPASFDETIWRQTVDEESRASLYEPHFHKGRYFNPWMDREYGGFMRFFKMALAEKTQYTREERDFKPGFIPGLKDRIKAMPSGDFIAWIGHSTFLIRLRGVYILTDPIFSERALFPKRVTPPALTAEEVNEITPEVTVLVSHNHYDHLDAPSIEALSDASTIIVPMGLKTYVEGMDKRHVKEMDWWQNADLGHGITVVSLPAQHWSRRLTQGANKTLWASYMIVTPETTIYFGGDSGYFTGYREYGMVFPRITYAIMPTTSLNPRAFMHYAHMNVDEALDAFRELNAKYFIPTHWGTFQISAEPPGYPILELRRKIESLNLDPSRYLIPDLGQLIPLEDTNTEEDRGQAAGGGSPRGP